MKQTPSALSMDRRSFMLGAAGLTFSVLHPGEAASAANQSLAFNSWVTIASDGSIFVMSPAVEMGQGSKTSLPLILAEELDADWNDVRIVPAAPNDAVYGNPGFGNMMYTAGSTAVSGYYAELRKFGAQVRRVLIDNAARRWNVSAAELTTEPSVVHHLPTSRSMTYGEIASFATVPDLAPDVPASALKRPQDFRLIGRDVMRRELPSKVDGSARYSIDIEVPGMLFGALLQPPVFGSSLKSLDDRAARAISGVVDVFKLAVGVGIVASTPWSAFAGKDALKVEWAKPARMVDFDSERALDGYAAIAGGKTDLRPTLWDKVGDGADAIQNCASVTTGEYRCDYAYHAQMEPLNALASVDPAGDSAEIWCGTQSQTMAVTATSKLLGISPQKVVFHEVLLGGAFGRRGPRDEDFLVGALLLSKAAKRPVKMLWTREDDVHAGRLRPASAHHVQIGFDAQGNANTWHHRLATDNAGLFQDPVRYDGPWKERDMISLAGTELPTYDIPNRLVEHFPIESGVRLSALRGIGFNANKFATETLLDEAALARNVDPLDFRLKLLANAPRGAAVVLKVGEMCDWNRPRQGRALGLAYIDYTGSQVAGVAEVSLDSKQGLIKVHRFWVAIDVGSAVQPDNIVAQMEGSVVFGLGLALTEQITLSEGEVQQSNFYDYTVMRMRDIPEIKVAVVRTDNPPTGAGQMATPLVAPAVGNAVARLSGVHLRRLPMLPDRVLAALKDHGGR